MLAFDELIKLGSFDAMVRALLRDRSTDEELLESRPDVRRRFVLHLAELAADANSHTYDVAPKIVMVALKQAGYEVDLFKFGQLIGTIMLANEGRLDDPQEIDNLVDEVITFHGEEKTEG